MTILPRPGLTLMEILAMAAVVLVAILSLTGPVQAYEKIEPKGVTEYHMEAPAGLVIAEIDSGVQFHSSNQSYILNSFGQIYKLDVNITSTLNSLWDVDFTFQYPNGTIEHIHESRFVLAPGGYRYTVQYGIPEIPEHISFTQVFVDLYIGFSPLRVGWNTLPPNPTDPGLQTHYDYIAFSEMSMYSTDLIDLVIYLVTPVEWQNITENDDLVWGLGISTGSLISWSWDMVLAFFNAIPYVGPYIATILEYCGLFVAEILYWVNFFLIENWDITILTVEFFIISHALLTTKTLWKLVQQILDDHIALYDFMLKVIFTLIDLIKWIVSLVAEIINAIIPV